MSRSWLDEIANLDSLHFYIRKVNTPSNYIKYETTRISSFRGVLHSSLLFNTVEEAKDYEFAKNRDRGVKITFTIVD